MVSKINLIGLTIILAFLNGTSIGIIFDGVPTIDKIFAQESKLPDWIKNIFVWYGQGQISEDEILNAIKFLVENDIIQLEAGKQPKSMMNMMDSSMMDDMPFNVNVPITIPMIDGYYNGEKVFFIHTEFSTSDMANMASMMINFPTLHASELQEIPSEETGKMYVFTNGIPGSGPYGGGPFMFQIDIFDSIPGQPEYNQLKVVHLVTWNDGSTPRILTSVDELLQAQTNGELTIQMTDIVVHAPMIVWHSDGEKQTATHIEKPFVTMSDFDAEVVNIDEGNYSTTLRFHPAGSMDMMMN